MHPGPHLTHLDAFRRCINRKYGLNLTNYTQLHKWSVDEIESFCREIWTFCGLVYTKPPDSRRRWHRIYVAAAAMVPGRPA